MLGAEREGGWRAGRANVAVHLHRRDRPVAPLIDIVRARTPPFPRGWRVRRRTARSRFPRDGSIQSEVVESCVTAQVRAVVMHDACVARPLSPLYGHDARSGTLNKRSLMILEFWLRAQPPSAKLDPAERIPPSLENGMVRPRGLEPPLVAQLAPQASASTNSATAAEFAGHQKSGPARLETISQYLHHCREDSALIGDFVLRTARLGRTYCTDFRLHPLPPVEDLVREMVRPRGLEPPLVAQLAPQASASTNSATAADCFVSPEVAGRG